jgi:hypothetical protein
MIHSIASRKLPVQTGPGARNSRPLIDASGAE